jgi:hypothetical protein
VCQNSSRHWCSGLPGPCVASVSFQPTAADFHTIKDGPPSTRNRHLLRLDEDRKAIIPAAPFQSCAWASLRRRFSLASLRLAANPRYDPRRDRPRLRGSSATLPMDRPSTRAKEGCDTGATEIAVVRAAFLLAIGRALLEALIAGSCSIEAVDPTGREDQRERRGGRTGSAISSRTHWDAAGVAFTLPLDHLRRQAAGQS